MIDVDCVVVVVLDGVLKFFGVLKVLDCVILFIGFGECLGLVGYNGVGKLMLVNLIISLFVLIEGWVVYFGYVDYLFVGICVILQEGMLCFNLIVLENLQVIQCDLIGWGWCGVVGGCVMVVLDWIFLGYCICRDMLVVDMMLVEVQMVEIVIGFVEGVFLVWLVVLDEFILLLDVLIVVQLMVYIWCFCGVGGVVIFILYMLGEIFDVVICIVVMCDGCCIVDWLVVVFLWQGLVDLMGYVVDDDYQFSVVVFVCVFGDMFSYILCIFEGIEVWCGEIVGLVGLVGYGQVEVLVCFYLLCSSDWCGSCDFEVVFVVGDWWCDGVMLIWLI